MKNKTFPDFRIKVDLNREIKEIDKESYYYIDKMYFVEIKYSNRRGIGFGVKATGNRGKDLRKIFKTIQKEMYL